MTSCTIIISHYESWSFLRACLRQIKKHQHPEVKQCIIIADQSSTYIPVDEEMDEDVLTSRMRPLYSGYGIDEIVRSGLIKTEYICQLHVDAFPIHPNWLYLPIKLIEENSFSFVGQLQFINGKDNLASIYPPNPFFAMAQCFNVAKTETYKEMSLEAGFTRFHNRPKSGLEFKNNDWAAWAAEDYQKRGSDDDVVAFHWQDAHKEVNKLGMAVTGFIQPSFGRLIEDIVFHFGSCRESIGTGGAMGEQYRLFTERIICNYSDELIEEMVNMAKINTPPETQILTRNFWNGKTKESSPPSEGLNKRIEELKIVTN